MKEFIINQFLKVKLENGKTLIYVDDKKVVQCKYLLLNSAAISDEEMDINNKKVTVDELAGNLDHSLELDEQNEFDIPPEAEFWAHSSNLQAWYENKYDTQVLHSNIAFPLLRKLTEAGDMTAKEVFKQEISNRFRSGNLNVMVFLTKEGYMDHLSIERYEELKQELDFDTFKKLQKSLKEANKHNEGFII